MLRPLFLILALSLSTAFAKDCPEHLLKSDQRQKQAAELGLNPAENSDFSIRRVQRSNAYAYLDQDGSRITSQRVLTRIEGLHIAPGLSDVRISADSKSHIQAIGIDAHGHPQYIYHPLWLEVRRTVKFDNSLPAFGKALPILRQVVTNDLRTSDLSLAHISAAIVRLLDDTLIRIGSKEYAEENKTYGLTTLLKSHVHVDGDVVTFSFLGKSSVRHKIPYTSAPIAKLIRQLLDVPGANLFKWVDEDGPHEITAADVNAYIRDALQADFTAKDFRTWGGTVAAAEFLHSAPTPDNERDLKHTLNAAAQATADLLENTPAVSRSSYIHPEIFKLYSEDPDAFAAAFTKAQRRLDRGATGRSLAEEAVLNIII